MTLIIVDVEASSLLPGGFPIEIGWVLEDGVGESHLIKPADDWLDSKRGHPGWSVESERIHGISLQTLLEDGEPVEAVARRAEAVLTPSTVLACSDAPSYDAAWLQRLFEAGGVRRTVSVVDMQVVYGWACRALLALLPPPDNSEREREEQRIRNLTREIVERAEEVEHVSRRVRHRALPDAMSLWRTRQAIIEEVRRHLRDVRRS